MGRKRKELPYLEQIEISGVAAEGKALAKVKIKPEDESQIVVFVPYGAPGDIADIKIDKRKHNYCEGHIARIIQKSPIRIDPECEHFGECGGCKWQHLPYLNQLEYKKAQIEDNFRRIGKIEIPEIKPVIPSDNIWNYRNKMEYTFSNKRWRPWDEIKSENTVTHSSSNALGFHISGAFDKVLQINNCHLQDNIGNEIRNFIFNYANENDYTFYNVKENKGLLRTLMIRISTLNQLMVCVVFGENDIEKINQILKAIKNQFPSITSLLYVVNLKLNDSIADQEIKTYYGPEFIEEDMDSLRYRINAKSFYQTNSNQAIKLYKTAKQFALRGYDKGFGEMSKKPLIYDLYTGAGTIANFMASEAEKVIGIEYVEEAIEDARLNSAINGITNTEFYAGDMKKVLTEEFISQHGRPDIMIVDPPRAGMHEDVIKVILSAEPGVLVYVSCNPATQARDLTLLDAKYMVTDIQPVDMFPHTHHIENVVRLVLKDKEL